MKVIIDDLTTKNETLNKELDEKNKEVNSNSQKKYSLLLLFKYPLKVKTKMISVFNKIYAFLLQVQVKGM